MDDSTTTTTSAPTSTTTTVVLVDDSTTTTTNVPTSTEVPADESVVLIYDVQGGSAVPNPERGDPNSVTLVTGDTPSHEGYVFAGWNTEPDGTGLTYEPGDEIRLPLSGSETIYAQWKAVSDEGNGGTSPEVILLPSTGGSSQTPLIPALAIAFGSLLVFAVRRR